MFSNCSGECCVCACGGFCLAGNGDDDFELASKETIIYNLDNGKYPDYTSHMIDTLEKVYGYQYKGAKDECCKAFEEKTKNATFSISSDGTISFGHLEKMTPQDYEDLSHLRIDNTTGILFDDRDKLIKEDF